MTPLKDKGSTTDQRLKAMVVAAVQMLKGGTGASTARLFCTVSTRWTQFGVGSIRPIADLGAPYPVLLYERFLAVRSLGTATWSASWWATSSKARSRTC